MRRSANCWNATWNVATQKRYEIAIRTHIKPLLGKHPISKLNGETFDSADLPDLLGNRVEGVQYLHRERVAFLGREF
jgi:Phage integrase, N-terminal SAM-like domain